MAKWQDMESTNLKMDLCMRDNFMIANFKAEESSLTN